MTFLLVILIPAVVILALCKAASKVPPRPGNENDND